jgi:hypothetical protein
MADDLVRLIHDHLGDSESGWNIGTFGAIAEFNHRDDEPAVANPKDDGGSLVGALGGVRVSVPSNARAVAYEGLSVRADAWTHGLGFCLPADAAALGGRDAITDLGPDEDALREADRAAYLFDLGLAIPHVDFCVRTDDRDLIDVLRGACGQSIFEGDAMAAIKATSPHRVSRSRLGRIEVYQGIGSTRRGVPTPEGPHTHVLPDLLRHRRTHAATTPIPDGWVPCLNLHPANPLRDRLGEQRSFDAAAHAHFQGLVGLYAPDGYAAEKLRIADAVRDQGDVGVFAPPSTRHGRLAAAVQLRQLAHTDGKSDALARFQAAFGRRGDESVDPHHGH